MSNNTERKVVLELLCLRNLFTVIPLLTGINHQFMLISPDLVTATPSILLELHILLITLRYYGPSKE